ncbi:MAG: hypothetical protein ACI97A_000371, partial [Planctomycetota bacterium]
MDIQWANMRDSKSFGVVLLGLKQVTQKDESETEYPPGILFVYQKYTLRPYGSHSG